MNRLRVGVVAALLAWTALAWRLEVQPRWTQRVPPDWTWRAHFVGVETWPNPETGELPLKDSLGVYDRALSIKTRSATNDAVVLEDRYSVRDPSTGRVMWQHVLEASVDPRTGALQDAAHAGQIFLFPRDVARRTYTIRNTYLPGIPVAFEREDDIAGLTTWVFSYRGRADLTAAYARTDEVEGIEVAPTEVIRCADDQYVYRVWVEPVTGEVVKLEESCYSGTYLYDRATGTRGIAVDRFGGITAGDDVLARAQSVRRERLRYLLASRVIPGGFGGAALVCLGIVLVQGRRTAPEVQPA